MTDPIGVNLLPASNEWVYDPLPHRARRAAETTPRVQNLYLVPGGNRTDYSYAIDQLQAAYPGCRTVSLVCAWFGNATDVTQCAIYPSTTFIGGTSGVRIDGVWLEEPWHCSGLTQASDGLIPISQTAGGAYVYGGTPSDPSIVRCIRDLKARGFRVVFYPFILMDCAAYPWRGRIAYPGADKSAAASAAIAAWFGGATPAQFSRDAARLTVGYADAPTDWTFRRMILHYANLCVIAGGVDLFLVGSEFRGLESVRGPGWSKPGTKGDGTVTWDYPFVAGLAQLAADVRGIFDAAGLAKDRSGLKNLVTYSPDWSSWMGVQHPGEDGQWPHLDQLFASPDIDLVSFDNYLPLSDWTTGDGGLDFRNWSAPKPTPWPPGVAAMNGLGLSGPPMLASKAYLKANIEGGEKFAWFYYDSTNSGIGLDPNGAATRVTRPNGDRLAQTRHAYVPGQEILANKQLRWWWNNPHRAVYDAGDGQGFAPHGPATKWVPRSKSISFVEYGFPTCDRCTNQPNVFYDPKSSESFTPYWSVWERAEGGSFRPQRDDTLAGLAREALVEYWTIDGRNETSVSGVKMIEPAFLCAWNWDARPFPVFPQSDVWGDAANWRAGTWIGGKGPEAPPMPPDVTQGVVYGPLFPALSGQGWSVTYTPRFTSEMAAHAAGRETRAGRTAAPLWEINMRFDVLSEAVRGDARNLIGFYAGLRGGNAPFYLTMPVELGVAGGMDFGTADDPIGAGSDQGLASASVDVVGDFGLASEPATSVPARFADDGLDVEAFARHLYAAKSVTLQTVRG